MQPKKLLKAGKMTLSQLKIKHNWNILLRQTDLFVTILLRFGFDLGAATEEGSCRRQKRF